MKGRRIPVPADGNIFTAVKEPGDYCGPAPGRYTHGKAAVAFLLPIPKEDDVPNHYRAAHHCVSPTHTFKEEPDGSLTIQPSILDFGAGKNWHGYLTKGEWTQC